MRDLLGKFLFGIIVYVAIIIASIFFTLTSSRDRQESQIVVYENFFGARPIHPQELKRQRAMEAHRVEALKRQQAIDAKRSNPSRPIQSEGHRQQLEHSSAQVRDQVF